MMGIRLTKECMPYFTNADIVTLFYKYVVDRTSL